MRETCSGASGEARANTACPRCGVSFQCGVGDRHPCPCGGVAVDAATLQRLRHRYQGCLCLACLRAEALAGVGNGTGRAEPGL